MQQITREIRTLLYFLGHTVYTGRPPDNRTQFLRELYNYGEANSGPIDLWIRRRYHDGKGILTAVPRR